MAMASKAAAKAAGKVKGAMKALAGYPGIFHHLAAEHMEVAILMKRVALASETSPVREELFREIRKSLLAHAHAEEEEFYSALRQHPELEQLVSVCTDEHQRIEELIMKLDAESPSSPAWTNLFQQFTHAVETHVRREENELFPKAKDLVGKDEADDMYHSYESAEEREKAALQDTQ